MRGAPVSDPAHGVFRMGANQAKNMPGRRPALHASLNRYQAGRLTLEFGHFSGDLGLRLGPFVGNFVGNFVDSEIGFVFKIGLTRQ